METTLTNTQSKSWLSYLPGVFLLGFLLTGTVFMLTSPNMFKSPEKTLWNGQWSLAYESDLNKGLAFRQMAIDTWGILDYGLFREGREGVLVGKDGWLFTSEEFTFYPEGDKGIREKLDLATNAQAQLAQQGIHLVVVVIPSKARVYSENLGRYTFPSYNQNLYQDFIAQLESKGIPAVNVLDALIAAKAQDHVFLKTDTHWTPYGAEVVARDIAKMVAEKGLLPSLDSSIYQTMPKETISHKGDLLNYIPLGKWQESIGPEFDRLEQRVSEGLEEGGGLFGSSSIPVALVGTSYSANRLWNFDGALKEVLGTDVLNVANQGEGPVVPMQDYLAGNDLKDTPAELVIWEIPERFVRVFYTK